MLKTVFMGTPEFAAKALEALIKSEHSVELVVSQPDAPKGRGKKLSPTPVKETAQAAGIPVIQPERLKDDKTAIDEIKRLEPDIIIVAAYGQILSKEVLQIPRLGCINVHASLLPRYRGAAPIQRVIIEGEKETGITIMQMSEGLDTGDMISKARTEIGHKTYRELHDELAEMGGELLTETLKDIESGTAVRTPQSDAESCYARMIFKKDGELDWNNSAAELERLCRGFLGAYTYLEGEPFKVWSAEVIDLNSDKKPGTVLSADNEGIKVACGSGQLQIKEVQAAGKKRMQAGDYLRGKVLAAGTLLGQRNC